MLFRSDRGVAVGYDSSNGVVTAFHIHAAGFGEVLWTRQLNHAAHPLLFADSGELVLCDTDIGRNAEQVVVLDIATGSELARADTGSPVQSVVFNAPGFERRRTRTRCQPRRTSRCSAQREDQSARSGVSTFAV